MNELNKLQRGVEASKELEEFSRMFADDPSMGPLATTTSMDLCRLADALFVNSQSTIDAIENDGLQENTFDREQLIRILKEVFDSMVETIKKYADSGESQQNPAIVYIDRVGDIIRYLQDIYANLDLEREFLKLLSTYGRVTVEGIDPADEEEILGVNSLDADFTIFLKRNLFERTEKNKIAAQSQTKEEELIDPRDLIREEMEGKVVSVTKTEIGGLAAAGVPLVVEGASGLTPSDTPPKPKQAPQHEHVPTARMGRNPIPRPDLSIPKPAPLPQIVDDDDPEITISGASREQEERIIADRRIIDVELAAPEAAAQGDDAKTGQFVVLPMTSDAPASRRLIQLEQASQGNPDGRKSSPPVRLAEVRVSSASSPDQAGNGLSQNNRKDTIIPSRPPAPLPVAPSASVRPAYFSTEDIPPSVPEAMKITVPPVDPQRTAEDEFSERITQVDLQAVPAVSPVRQEQKTVFIEQDKQGGIRNTTPDRISSEPPLPQEPSLPQFPIAQEGTLPVSESSTAGVSPVYSFATTHAPTIPAKEELVAPVEPAANDVDLPEVMPSSYRKGPSSRPPMKPVSIAPVEEPSPFTSAWAQQNNAAVEPASPPVADANSNLSEPSLLTGSISQAPLAPIAPPEDVQMPSSYLQTLSASADQKKQPSSLEITQITTRPETPDKVQKSTRSKIWKWAGAAAVALGLAGLVGLIKGNDNGEQATDTTPSGPSASTLVGPSASPLASAASSAEVKTPAPEVEKTAAGEKGIYRIDMKGAAFQNYLCHMKGAPGLAASIKDTSIQTKVNYYQNGTEFDAAKVRGGMVLTGGESEKELRLAVMEAYLNQAVSQPTDSHFVRNYFQHQKSAFNHFKATGEWNQEGLNYGADKLYNAIQSPEKLTTAPGVVGYAPDANLSSNPAWKKVENGAPTFYRIAKEAAQQMNRPENAVPYDDFRLVKEATCRQINKITHNQGELRKLGLAHNPDVQAGSEYMHRQWCTGYCAPENALDRVIQRRVPVYGEKVQPAPVPEQKPAKPATSPTPTNIIPEPSHSELDRILPGIPIWRGNVPAAVQPARHAETVAPQKEGLLAKAASKVKSFFGFGKKEAAAENATRLASAQTAAPSAPAATLQPEFTKKDLPMNSWGKTILDFFWG
jgi:hypothetical protein